MGEAGLQTAVRSSWVIFEIYWRRLGIERCGSAQFWRMVCVGTGVHAVCIMRLGETFPVVRLVDARGALRHTTPSRLHTSIIHPAFRYRQRTSSASSTQPFGGVWSSADGSRRAGGRRRAQSRRGVASPRLRGDDSWTTASLRSRCKKQCRCGPKPQLCAARSRKLSRVMPLGLTTAISSQNIDLASHWQRALRSGGMVVR